MFLVYHDILPNNPFAIFDDLERITTVCDAGLGQKSYNSYSFSANPALKMVFLLYYFHPKAR